MSQHFWLWASIVGTEAELLERWPLWEPRSSNGGADVVFHFNERIDYSCHTVDLTTSASSTMAAIKEMPEKPKSVREEGKKCQEDRSKH